MSGQVSRWPGAGGPSSADAGRLRRTIRWFALPLLLGLVLLPALAGCSPARRPETAGAGRSRPAAANHASASQSRPSRPAANQTAARETEAEVPADAFASVDQAVEALVRAAQQRDSQQRLRASGWLARQGAAAVPALRGVLDDQQADTAAKIAACRALGRIGGPATETLIAQLDDSEQLVRINALDQLPHIRPPTRQIVEVLIGALDHDDPRMRQQAIRGLAILGPTAKDAAPRLQEILNAREDEALRSEAKKALEQVDPRRTLTFD